MTEKPLPVDVQNAEPLEVEIDDKEPVQVEIDDKRPVQVEVIDGQLSIPVRGQSGKLHLPPETTEQEDIVTAGQQAVNLVWEYTQAAIAIVVVASAMIKAILITQGQEFPVILGMAFGTVVGFYFGRTNHQAIGGVGKKPNRSR